MIINNIIANPGNYAVYDSLPYKDPEMAYVHKLSKQVKIDMTNNLFTRDISELKFIEDDKGNARSQRILLRSTAVATCLNIM